MLNVSNLGFRFSLAVIAGCGLLASRAAPAAAQDSVSPAEISRLKADVARLEQELQQQKQLLIQLMQSEQQRYDMLMQLIRSGQLPRTGELRPSPAPGGAPALLPPSSPGPGSDPAAARSGGEAAPAVAARTAASVSGKVRFPGNPVDAYVYVEGLRGGSGRGRTLEIKQQGKQFHPSMAVVLTGTRLTFPNFDSVAHNAFSRSPGNAFDLGNINAGEKSEAGVMLTRPGSVQVFCNIHSRMRADILVASSNHYAKVRPDGSFDISSVPLGVRKVTLWSPYLNKSSQTVEVTPRGASLSFTPQASARQPHVNKLGQPYGSYNE